MTTDMDELAPGSVVKFFWSVKDGDDLRDLKSLQLKDGRRAHVVFVSDVRRFPRRTYP